MSTNIRLPFIFSLIILWLFIILSNLLCTSPAPVVVRYGFWEQQLDVGKERLEEGKYEMAKMVYTKIRDDCMNVKTAAEAQFNLAMVDIYYDNPFADYEAALREFKRFASLYPKDKKTDLVNNLINILTAFKGFSRDFKGNTNELNHLRNDAKKIQKNYKHLRDAHSHCESKIDSLENRIKKLTKTIEKLPDM